jgi:hypothetical protein
MRIDDISITTNRNYDSDDHQVPRDDRCRVYMSLEIRVTDSDRTDSQDEAMTVFRSKAEKLISEVKEYFKL